MVVGGHHDRGPGAVDALQQIHDVLVVSGAEVAGGLVGQQHQRPVDERPGDRHPLLLAAGQFPGRRLALPDRPTISSTSGTTRLMVSGRPPMTSRAKATFSNTVVCCSSRKSWKTADDLPPARDVPVGLVDPELRHLDLTGGVILGEQQTHEGRFSAGSRRPDQEDELTLVDLDADLSSAGRADCLYCW